MLGDLARIGSGHPGGDGPARGGADVRSVAYACAVLGVCAELAAQVSRGPGSFRVALIDQLHLISEEDIYKMAKVGP